MEQYFRIALWMCLLMGYLQAASISRPCIAESDMGYPRLRKVDVSSGDTKMNFTSPVWPGQCNATAAAKVYIQELEKIKEHLPKSQTHYVSGAVNALNTSACLNEVQTDTECNVTVQDTFADFVGALEKFVQELNSGAAARQN